LNLYNIKALYDTAPHLIIVMAFKDSAKSELHEIAIKSSKNFPLFGTSLASIESLSMPKVCIFTYFILGFDLCLGWR